MRNIPRPSHKRRTPWSGRSLVLVGSLFGAGANAQTASATVAPGSTTASATPRPSLSTEPSAAQPAPAVPTVTAMTLAQAVEYARGHQPELRAARERFLAAAADARIAAAEWLPSAGLAVEGVAATANNSTATPLPVGTVDLTRIGGTAIGPRPRWQPYATTLAAVGAHQELFDFGRIAAESAADEALVTIERDRLQKAHLDVVLLVTNAYYAVRAAHAVSTAASQAEERARIHRDFAETAVKTGLRPPIELTRAAADLTKFAVGRIRAEGNIRVARTVFAAAVGYPQAELDATDSPNATSPVPNLAEVERRALANYPDLLLARDLSRAQRTRTVAIEASTRPNLYASASISGRAGGAPASSGSTVDGNGFVPVVPNYDVGVVLAWPFYEPTVNAAARASEQRQWALDAESVAAQQRVRAEAQQAYRKAVVAESTLTALMQATDAARANYEQADARFRSGMGTSTELADAESVRLDAEMAQAVGGFELATARAQLAHVMGD